MKNRFEIGEALETEIVAITDNTIFLDLSAKSEGVLDRTELEDDNGNVSVKEGDKITVYFTIFLKFQACCTVSFKPKAFTTRLMVSKRGAES